MGIHKQFRQASSWIVALAVAGLGSGVAVGETDIYLSLQNPVSDQYKFIVTRVVGPPVPIGVSGNQPDDVSVWLATTATIQLVHNYTWNAVVHTGKWLGDVPPFDQSLFGGDGGLQTRGPTNLVDYSVYIQFTVYENRVAISLFKNGTSTVGEGEGLHEEDFFTMIATNPGTESLGSSWYGIFKAGCYPMGEFSSQAGVTVWFGDRCLSEGLPGNYFFSAPSLARVVVASKGSKNSVNLGNSGFAPVGNGMLVGVGYDRADNSVSNTRTANFDGNDYRIHLDLLKGHNNFIYGIAGEYREGKYTLSDLTTKYKTKYYGPRVDLGYRGIDSWAQLSGGYYFGNAYVDDDKGSNGYLAQLGLLAQMDKWLSNRFSLKPGVDVQYIWQKLGTISGLEYENRNYGRADLNLGLGIAFNRGWALTPNLGYRWDIRSACTRVQGAATKICEPKANGLRYGVQLAKAVLVTGSRWDELAVSAYWDYFKKSGVKQNVWGVMAQYPF